MIFEWKKSVLYVLFKVSKEGIFIRQENLLFFLRRLNIESTLQYKIEISYFNNIFLLSSVLIPGCGVVDQPTTIWLSWALTTIETLDVLINLIWSSPKIL